MDGGELRGIYHWQGPDQLSELQIAKVLSEVGAQDVTMSTMTDDAEYPCDVLVPRYPAVWVFGILHEGLHREHDTCLTPLRPLVKQQPHCDQDPPVVLIGHWMSRD